MQLNDKNEFWDQDLGSREDLDLDEIEDLYGEEDKISKIDLLQGRRILSIWKQCDPSKWPRNIWQRMKILFKCQEV